MATDSRLTTCWIEKNLQLLQEALNLNAQSQWGAHWTPNANMSQRTSCDAESNHALRPCQRWAAIVNLLFDFVACGLLPAGYKFHQIHFECFVDAIEMPLSAFFDTFFNQSTPCSCWIVGHYQRNIGHAALLVDEGQRLSLLALRRARGVSAMGEDVRDRSWTPMSQQTRHRDFAKYNQKVG
jgi:hypothetical protein